MAGITSANAEPAGARVKWFMAAEAAAATASGVGWTPGAAVGKAREAEPGCSVDGARRGVEPGGRDWRRPGGAIAPQYQAGRRLGAAKIMRDPHTQSFFFQSTKNAKNSVSSCPPRSN